MKQTLDDYRLIAETNPDVAALLDLIDRMQRELTNALSELVKLQSAK